MEKSPVRYQSDEEDSGRWDGFPFRAGDIVISTRSKTGTTWVQMICALLIFQTPDLPAPLGRLSPWLDHTITPLAEVTGRLEDQQHRRFIKTHTPLDGIPLDPRATYLVTARNPLDMSVSLYHQGDNIDRARVRQLTGQPEPSVPTAPRPPLREWLLQRIDSDADPRAAMDSLPGVMWHLSDAWARRGEPNVMLVHYDNLSADLEGQMRRIAGRLGIGIPEARWPGPGRGGLVRADARQLGQPGLGRRDSQGQRGVLPPRHIRRRSRDSLAGRARALPGAHRPAGAAGSARLAALPR